MRSVGLIYTSWEVGIKGRIFIPCLFWLCISWLSLSLPIPILHFWLSFLNFFVFLSGFFVLHFSGVGYVYTDTDDRHRQSRWIGSSIPQLPSRRKKSSNTVSAVNTSQKADSMSPPPSDQESTNPTTSKSETSKSHKKRSTMNSRDSAYDYSDGLGISTLPDDDKDDEGSIHGSRTSMSKRRGKRVAEDDDEDNSPTSSSNPRSKRRRGSNDDTEDPQDPAMEPVIPRAKPKKSHKKQIREDPSPSLPSLHPNPNSSDLGQ